MATKDDAVKLAERPAVAETMPVLAVGLGRGSSGKSTVLAEMAWRAANQGREVIVADFDARSATLAGMFQGAMQPPTEETADGKAGLSQLLNRMAREKKSAVLDLGGGDRLLQEYGRDLRLVEFCARRGIQPLAVYVLGPEAEDLAHVLSIWRAGYFRPERTVLVFNEGVIRADRTVAGAFERALNDAGCKDMGKAGAKPLMLKRLACMGLVRDLGVGFYEAATGGGAQPLDPVEEFQVEQWLADWELARTQAGVAGWLP